jgi:hypothetical protein
LWLLRKEAGVSYLFSMQCKTWNLYGYPVFID